jgi:hypothetical protein
MSSGFAPLTVTLASFAIGDKAMPSVSSAARRARAAADPPDPYAGGLFANQGSPVSNAGNSSSPPVGAPVGASNQDIPFEVRGFATDPKHSGYQILTNYESTYWRAFVGVPAWALYEVLRSFCHNGNNVCYPSINYLLEVLGIKQRRVLTGWSTEVKGKSYYYAGLIEILQGAGLVIAEVIGEGPMQRYLFHVNLTPDLLRPEQIAELPVLLQNKHAEMLQAHFAEMAELASRRRPAKAPSPTPIPQENMQNNTTSTKNIVESGGMTNCQRGVTNCHTPSDNLSHKQHQYNNTQLTRDPSTNWINNNSGALQQELPLDDKANDVVVALTNLGLADSVVQRLSSRYHRQRILEKIDYLAYLQEFHPNKVKNPRGWLRRAIEENYGAPDGYLPPEQRAMRLESPEEPEHVSYAAFVDEEEVAATQAAQANAVAEREYLRASRRELVRRHYAPDAATLAFWELVQTDVRFTMTPDYYRLIAEASVLWMDEETLVIAIWDREIYRELLHPNRVKALARTINSLAKRQGSSVRVNLVCEYWDEEGQVVPPGTPPP